MIQQNMVFIVTIKDCQNYSYLPNRNGKLIICALPHGSNIQLKLLVSINIFKVKAKLLEFQLAAKK